jgi:hypothetical protein
LALQLTKAVLRNIQRVLPDHHPARYAIRKYISRSSVSNDALFRELAERLPGPPPGRSLRDLQPEIAKEWHSGKNGRITPESVSAGSNIAAWWRCTKGHEWRVSVSQRTLEGTGCPVCSGRVAAPDTSLAALKPEVAREWHPTRNREVSPGQVRPGSHRKVWWKCRAGHEWISGVKDRALSGQGCPYCAHVRASPGYNLEVEFPDLARQWHPTRNGRLKPNEVLPGSGRLVWWRCIEGHEWRTRIVRRTADASGCKVCRNKPERFITPYRNFATSFPDQAREWHPTKNEGRKPEGFAPFSQRTAWWKCLRMGHEWESAIARRSGGEGCPYCAGKRVAPDNCFALHYPALAKEWHPTKNGTLTPEQVTRGSKRRVWWLCRRARHEWRAIVLNRAYGTRCPQCSRQG